MSRGSARLIVAVGLVSIAGSAAAQPAPPSSRVRTGGFVRVQLGADQLLAQIGEGENQIDLTGTGAAMAITMGTMLSRSWALHGELFHHGMTDPRVSFANSDGDVVEGLEVGYRGLGVGVTHHLGGGDSYLALTIAAASLRFQSDGDSEASTGPRGPMVVLQAGHEWWTSERWTSASPAGCSPATRAPTPASATRATA